MENKKLVSAYLSEDAIEIIKAQAVAEHRTLTGMNTHILNLWVESKKREGGANGIKTETALKRRAQRGQA